MDLPVINPEVPKTGGCSAGGCVSSAGRMDGMSDEIRARVQGHPCHSEDARRYFARIHVAVAPPR